MARKALFNPVDNVSIKHKARYKEFRKPVLSSETRRLIGRAIDRGVIVLAPNLEASNEASI